MEQVVFFCLFVGVGSTLVLDLWVLLVEKVLGIPPTNWGVVGRWLKGIAAGRFVADTTDDSKITLTEKSLGWCFHYIIGVVYAALILIIYGVEFISNPTLAPVIVVGVVLSTIAGLGILMPALGAGFFGRLLPNKAATYVYLVVAHAIFAGGQFAFSVLYC